MMNRQLLKKEISNKMQSMGGMNALRAQAAKAIPRGSFYRQPTIDNKARGTMSSATYTPMGGL
jgi:hypothetical protein